MNRALRYKKKPRSSNLKIQKLLFFSAPPPCYWLQKWFDSQLKVWGTNGFESRLIQILDGNGVKPCQDQFLNPILVHYRKLSFFSLNLWHTLIFLISAPSAASEVYRCNMRSSASSRWGRLSTRLMSTVVKKVSPSVAWASLLTPSSKRASVSKRP